MMKRLLFIFYILLMGPCMMAQIQLTPYLPDELAQKSPETYRLLINKLNNLISHNGLVISGNSERFILTCNCVEVSKHIVPGAPNKYAYVMDCNFYIGDGVSGVKYASISVPTKGVGNSESKAYINAIKNLRTQSPLISDFLNNGTNRIIDYYERQSQGIFSSAKACMANGDYQQATYLLNLVPQGCSHFDEAQELLVDVFNQMNEADSRKLLMQAKGLWAANQNQATANQAVDILSQIEPFASSYNEAQDLIKSIYSKIDVINKRTWNEYVRNQEHQRKMEQLEVKAQMERDKQNAKIRETSIKAAAAVSTQRIKANAAVNAQKIRAARDVAVAYALTRPRVVYHVHGWY